jgi:hypothetical protein
MRLTMPGSKPPSATPKSALTVTKDAKFDTNPRHIVSIPQTVVSNGSHIFGDIFFSTRFDGSSLNCQPYISSRLLARTYLAIYVA